MTFKKNNKIWVGRKHTEETKRKISEAGKGREFSDEHIARLSDAARLRTGSKNPNYGKHHTFSDETRKRMSIAHTGVLRGRMSEEQKCKISIAKTGELLGEKSPAWKGGKKVVYARRNHKRRGKGFIILPTKNSYNEVIDYHHIHPNLPFVVPVPKRVHILVPGNLDKYNHFWIVNSLIGFEFPSLMKHTNMENDVENKSYKVNKLLLNNFMLKNYISHIIEKVG